MGLSWFPHAGFWSPPTMQGIPGATGPIGPAGPPGLPVSAPHVLLVPCPSLSKPCCLLPLSCPCAWAPSFPTCVWGVLSPHPTMPALATDRPGLALQGPAGPKGAKGAMVSAEPVPSPCHLLQSCPGLTSVGVFFL